MQAGDFKRDVLPLCNKMLRFAFQILQDREEAKDVLQDVYLKLWQKREELGKVDNLEAFMMRMMRNRCFDVIRKKHTVSVELVKKTNLQEGLTSETDHFENVDTAGFVKQIISHLPNLQRSVIHLRDIEMMEYDEIAEVTQMNLNAIKTNLSRARKKVRDEILKIQNYGITGNKNIVAKIL